MTCKVGKLVKGIIISVIEKINIVKEFCAFVRNPRKHLSGNKLRDACPDVLKNPIYGNHEICQLPGVRLHYVESGQRDKELLLFVHGFPDFWFTWKHQILEFSNDYWTVAVDMRGYGDSEKRKKVSFYKMNLLVEDIRNLVLALGREKFTLIAHDWGGVVAHYFIRIHPEMLNRYILLNTVFHPKLGATFVSDTKQLLKSWYILILQIPYYAEYFFMRDDFKNIELLYKDIMPREEVEAYKFTFGSYDKIRPPINYYRANFKDWKKERIPDAGNLNAHQVSGLYIHGENDFALTEEISFRKSFEGVDNIRFATVPKAGHFVHIHSPNAVNQIIHNFLQSTGSHEAMTSDVVH